MERQAAIGCLLGMPAIGLQNRVELLRLLGRAAPVCLPLNKKRWRLALMGIVNRVERILKRVGYRGQSQ